MKKLNYPCPCGGKVKWTKERVIQDGVDCGVLDVEICERCDSKYFPEESVEIIEDKLKEKGLWGSRKEVKLWKSGGSVVIRLPIEISRSMDLAKIKKGYIYPEGKRKILFEF